MRKNRIPELDGLRVLMIAVVSWFHIWQQSWLFPDIRISGETRSWLTSALGIDLRLYWLVQTGYIWVDGTVLLSVFLLYLPWAEANRTGAPVPSAKDFYYRRARRIIPAYYFIVLCHLLVIALPWKWYGNDMPRMVKDLVTHLTFTFTRYPDTSPPFTGMPGAAWTLAVLVHGYLLFPLMARGLRKHPAPVLGGMILACFAFRAWCLWSMSSYSTVVNRLVNFLDVYVLGVLCATGYDALRARKEKKAPGRLKKRIPARNRYMTETVATVLFLLFLYGLIRMLQIQAKADHFSKTSLSAWQTACAPAFAACAACLSMIGILCFSGRGAGPDRQKTEEARQWKLVVLKTVLILLFYAALYGLIRVMLAMIVDRAGEMQAWQMLFRPVFALCFAGLIMTAPFALLPLRKLLGNPVTRFLAGISMNYYLIHQTVAVHLKTRLQIPWTDSYLGEDFLLDGLYPNQINDSVWQGQYTLACFAVSLVMAVAVTYLVEKPCARLFDQIKTARRKASC